MVQWFSKEPIVFPAINLKIFLAVQSFSLGISTTEIHCSYQMSFIDRISLNCQNHLKFVFVLNEKVFSNRDT